MAALTLLVACNNDPERETTGLTTQPTGVSTVPVTVGTGDVPTTSSGSDTGDATNTAGSAGTTGPVDVSTGSSDGSGGPKLDIGAGDLGGTTGAVESGCTKVDFLFVIDNSTSMEDNQKALIDSFPGFIESIKTALGDVTDYHVMVVDTDANGHCAQPCDPNEENYAKFCAKDDYYACKAALDGCDVERGAGVVHPVGSFASNKKCELFGGNRYMVSGEPDLLGAFACVAKVGTAGSAAERPMDAIEAAVGSLNQPGQCNAGFVRDDAILVITFLSDDGNYVDKGTPEEWKASIVAAKNGDENAVVVAGLIPKPKLGCTNPQSDDNTQGSHWQEFVDLWGKHGLSGSICEADYAPFFAEAVAAIDQTCEQFNPPG
jgi:hypothetical protein